MQQQDSNHAEHNSVRHVSVNGSDANPGTLEAPWRTIGHAVGRAAAGMIVRVHEGEYCEQVVVAGSGSPEAPFILEAADHEHVVVSGAGAELSVPPPNDGTAACAESDGSWPNPPIARASKFAGLVQLVGVCHIVIRNLVIQDVGPAADGDHAGIFVRDCHHVTIEGVTTINTRSSGIGVWRSRYVRVVDNEVVLACNDGGQECVTVAGCRDFEVGHNHIHRGGPGTYGGEGLDVKHGSTHGTIHHNHCHHLNRVGLYVEAWDAYTGHIDMHDNYVHHNQADGIAIASELGGLIDGVRVFDNVIVHNAGTGCVVAWYGDVESQPVHNVSVTHNTFLGNGGSTGGGIWLENPQARGIDIRDNLVADNVQYQIAFREDVARDEYVVENNWIIGFRDHPGEVESEHRHHFGVYSPEYGG